MRATSTLPRSRIAQSNRQPLAVTVAQMRAMEDEAITRFHMPRALLMEHAGLAVSRATLALLRQHRSSRVAVCCGGGYNGGDGCVAARHLSNGGARVEVWMAQSASAEECVLQTRLLQALGVPVRHESPPSAALRHADVIVDGLLGIGLRHDVRAPYAHIIAAMNGSRRPIVAVDVPSGLDADAGEPRGIAVRARCTVTFGLPKRGVLAAQAAPFVGRLIVDPIGFPAPLLTRAAIARLS